MKRLLILTLIFLVFVACSNKEKQAYNKPELSKLDNKTAEVEEAETTEVAGKEMKPISQKAESSIDSSEKPETEEPAEESKTVKPVVEADTDDKEMSEAELWDAYKVAKEKLKVAKEEDDYSNIEKYLLETAKYSGRLERVDIEAWQYNNLGFNLIESFKSKTKYMSATGKLNSMVAGKKRNQYRAEIKGKFLKHKELLLRAKKYLKIAEELDNELEESSRTTTIESNKLFIAQVLGFIN